MFPLNDELFRGAVGDIEGGEDDKGTGEGGGGTVEAGGGLLGWEPVGGGGN